MFVGAMEVHAASSGQADTLGSEDGVRLSIRGVVKRLYEVAEACVDGNHSPEESHMFINVHKCVLKHFFDNMVGYFS